MNPYKLNWGEITPDRFDRSRNQAIHVLNVFMENTESRGLSLNFLIGRIIWFNKHLPLGCSHRIRIDIGGQVVPIKILNNWRESALLQIRKNLPTIKVEIEFLV